MKLVQDIHCIDPGYNGLGSCSIDVCVTINWVHYLTTSVALECKRELLLDLREPARAKFGGLLLRAVEELEDHEEAKNSRPGTNLWSKCSKCIFLVVNLINAFTIVIYDSRVIILQSVRS